MQWLTEKPTDSGNVREPGHEAGSGAVYYLETSGRFPNSGFCFFIRKMGVVLNRIE